MPEIPLVSIQDEKTANGIYCRKVWTSTSADPLLLIMGYGGSLRIWPTTFVEKLAERFTVIVYDNRGTGLSIVPERSEDYSIKAMAEDAREVIDLFEIKKHHLLGFSMGSCIALQYAYSHPESVRSLFLLCGTAGGAFYAKPDKAFSAALANPPGKTLWDVYMSTWGLMFSPEAMINCQPILTDVYEKSKDTPSRPLALAGHSNAFRQFDGTSFLPHLQMPTTVMAGNDDRLMPLKNSENLAENIPGARFVLVPECQHCPHIQVEDNVVAEIIALAERANS